MTKNASETARMLHVIARREQKEDKKVVAIRSAKTQMSLRERQQFVVEGLPSISAVLAKRLLSHFGSIRDLANASEEDLCRIAGIGKNIATDILELLNTDYKE